MKLIAICILTFFWINCFAQYDIKWGKELKLDRSVVEMEMIAADNTGSYFIQQDIVSRGVQMIWDDRPMNYSSVTLIKFGNNAEQLYAFEHQNFCREYEFIDLAEINNKLFIFGSVYKKKEGAYKIYANEIDKNTGAFTGDQIEVGSYVLTKKEYNTSNFVSFKAALVKNKDNEYLVVSQTGFAYFVRVGVLAFDGSVHQKSITEVTVPRAYHHYSLWDARMTGDKIVLFEKWLEDRDPENKDYAKVFKNFNIAVYDLKGTKIKDLNMDKPGSFTLEAKLFSVTNNEVALAGFYSKTTRRNMDGFFIKKIDVTTGELISSSVKEITPGMLGKTYIEDDEEYTRKDEKQKKQIEKSMENFNDKFLIKSIDVNPVDGSFMIAAEIADISGSYVKWEPTYSSPNRSTRYLTTHTFRNKDMVFISADKKGAISWMTIVPKKQEEIFQSERVSYTDGIFSSTGGMPNYSSFNSGYVNNKYTALYIDNKNNGGVTKAGDKATSIFNFSKRGELFALSFDPITGVASKTPVADCSNEEVILMPRHSIIVGNTAIIPACRKKVMGKTAFKIARLTL